MIATSEPASRPATPVLELRPDHVLEMEGNRTTCLERATDLLASMREEGQLVPGLVRRLPESPGKFLCLAGHRRLLCCRVLGLPFRALEVQGEADEARLVKLAITDNALRKQLSILELGESIERYAQAAGGGLSQAELAAELKLLPSEVSRALGLPKKLAPDLHAVARDRAVPRTFLELIASVPEHDKQRELMSFVIQSKPKRDALERRVAELRGKKKLKKPPVLLLKSGGCKLEVKDPSAESIAAFLDAVSAALKKAQKEALPLGVLPGLMKS